MNFLDDRLPARFWMRLQPCPVSGCWLWSGATVVGGYGRTKIGTKSILVHRLTYQAAVGPIAPGLVVDHKCRTTCCCNPNHLEAVTQQVNVQRGEGLASTRAKQTHCKRGHHLVGDNLRTFERSPGRFMRACLACERATGVHRRTA